MCSDGENGVYGTQAQPPSPSHFGVFHANCDGGCEQTDAKRLSGEQGGTVSTDAPFFDLARKRFFFPPLFPFSPEGLLL